MPGHNVYRIRVMLPNSPDSEHIYFIESKDRDTALDLATNQYPNHWVSVRLFDGNWHILPEWIDNLIDGVFSFIEGVIKWRKNQS